MVGLHASLGDGADGQESVPPRVGGNPVDLPGVQNVIAVSANLYSGGVPEGDEGFASLRRLGIKTVLSVDGARPNVARAKKAGLRYVHLPIGYDGISQEQAYQLARAVRDLPGPIFVHCHHGKHRSPAAAAAIQLCLDKKCTAADAINIMKRAGTDPRYLGLYAAPKELKRPTKEDLDRIEADFPEVRRVPPLAQTMVHIDVHWEHLAAVRTAGWQSPKAHPDLDPPHEALQLLEHYRELARLPETKQRPADFKKWLGEGETAAADLESVLRADTGKKIDATVAEMAYQRARMACVQCHAKYRDVPQTK